MAVLARTVRFCLSRQGHPLLEPRHNTHAGWPPMVGLGASWAITIELQGNPDPRTGYLVGIDRVDQAVREGVVPWLLERWEACEEDSPATLLPGIHARLTPLIPSDLIHAIELIPEPMGRFRLESNQMGMVSIARKYEFSASHRLALPDSDAQENLRLFGKCSNLNGHGHNYELEVEVDVALTDSPLDVTGLDRVVNETVISRFDHQHLNEDLDDFDAVVASVENLTSRCIELLEEPIASLGGTLRRVTVWETPRTACTISI